MNRNHESIEIAREKQALRIKMVNGEQRIGSLSGGNQQKVILARWMARNPRILIVDEPTRGVDVGAKSEVHHLLRSLADTGIAVIAISSDLLEIIALCDRVLTLSEGRLTGEFAAEAATEAALMAKMAPSSEAHSSSS